MVYLENYSPQSVHLNQIVKEDGRNLLIVILFLQGVPFSLQITVVILVKQGVRGDDCDHPDDEHDVGVPRNLGIIVILLQQS